MEKSRRKRERAKKKSVRTSEKSTTVVAAVEDESGGGCDGRLDVVDWQIRRRIPPRYRNAKNDVYITRKTKLVAQLSKCKKLLDTKCDSLLIHALGHAIGRALKLALLLRDAMAHSVKLDVQTSSVQVTDDALSLSDADMAEVQRQRTVSAVHILVTRL